MESVGCAVHGSWCTRLSGYGGGCTEVRDSKRFVRRRVEPSSFVVVRVLASESALSAAGPCVSGRHVPPAFAGHCSMYVCMHMY